MGGGGERWRWQAAEQVLRGGGRWWLELVVVRGGRKSVVFGLCS